MYLRLPTRRTDAFATISEWKDFGQYARSPTASADRNFRASSGASILVVDDDIGTRETFEWALRPFGFQVLTASSGAEALTIAASERFDLLLLDLQLPDMLGTDVIRDLPIDTVAPFILISAFLTTQVTVEAMKLGAIDVLEKPISIDDLPGLVNCAIRYPLRSRPGKPAAQDVASRPSIRLADSSYATPPGSAAERWAIHVIKGCESDRDPKTLQDWASCAGVSYTSLRESCRLVGIQPHDARDFMRVLRAVRLGSTNGYPPAVLLDVSDGRTLEGLFERAGLKSATAPKSISVDHFFQHQRFVVSDNAALLVLCRILASSMN